MTHLEGLRESLVAFVRYADRAGLRAPVPTCPGWKVRHLVAHQGMVHRWAASRLRGEAGNAVADERVGMNVDDPLEWLRVGALELATVIAKAPPDVVAPVFLADAPAPRQFWARRQCHETTIHAVDALAAALGRAPSAGEVAWVDDEQALDGVDELLTGFLPREGQGLERPRPERYLVAPEGAGRGWLVELGPGVARTTRLSGGELAGAQADAELRTGPVGAYLALWNRSGDPLPTEWRAWRELVHVEWS